MIDFSDCKNITAIKEKLRILQFLKIISLDVTMKLILQNLKVQHGVQSMLWQI